MKNCRETTAFVPCSPAERQQRVPHEQGKKIENSIYEHVELF